MATVEVIHFRTQPNIDQEEFLREDRRVAEEFTPKQPGYVSRESAKNDNGDWTVIVHWDNAASAEASMGVFPDDPTAKRFLEMMDSSTFTMTRYEVVLNT